MKRIRLSRRNFFKLSALGAGTLALSTVIGAALEAAQASNSGPMFDATPPAFTPIPSALAFGTPADVAMGWDGTLWAADTSSGAHVFDPAANAWQPHGDGVDGVARLGNFIYHFAGPQFLTVTFGTNAVAGAPQNIIDTWPWLPYSFRYGVQGAASVNGKLTLFHSGRYVEVDPNQPTVASPVKKLTDLANWPNNPDWAGGTVDAVMGNGSAVVRLFRAESYISVDLVAGKVLTPNPAPISSFVPWQGRVPADWLASGIDAAFSFDGNDSGFTLYRGSAAVYFPAIQTSLQPQNYIAATYSGWPRTWLPLLKHAPSGRVGNLWAVTTDGGVVYHDGAQWNDVSIPSATILSVAVGNDGTVFAISASDLYVHAPDGAWHVPIPLAAVGTPVQVSVGDATRVWVLNTSNQVWRYNSQPQSPAFAQVNPGVPATHMAANADGTLWHCNAADPNAYRFISEGTAAPQAIPVPTAGAAPGATVQRVASTGFGNSFCLLQVPAASGLQGAQPAGPGQIYQYNSNYVFKTSASYDTVRFGQIEQGLGLIFFTTEEQLPGGGFQSALVALDVRTGQQQWRTRVSGPNVRITSPVYDPLMKLVYVTSAPNDPLDVVSAGYLIAVNALIGIISWASPIASDGSTIIGIDASPGLSGNSLCVTDRGGRTHLFDAAQALADNTSGKGAQAKWTAQGPTGDQVTRMQPPLIAGGYVYTATWTLGSAGAFVVAQQRNLSDGSLAFSNSEDLNPGWTPDLFVPVAPVLGDLLISNQKEPAIYVNGYDTLWALALGSGILVDLYRLTNSISFSSGLTYDNGLVWVGDSDGRLWAFDNTVAPVANTPVQTGSDSIFTTPVVDRDAAGNTYVAYGTFGPLSHQVWIFNPNEPAGAANPASVDTGQTAITLLSKTVSNGVIYAAGDVGINPQDLGSGQVFAINIDRATQALRDIIIESQLLQDFDDPEPGQTAPPTYARYQTHLTFVDDNKIPRPHEAVKIWADAPTLIAIDGQPVRIGPGDADYAPAQTGPDGSLVITTGFIDGPGVDPTDVHATPLRVWAGFMDPCERVVVFTDQAFHTRVTTATVVTDTTSPLYDDPTVVNLHAAASYAPTGSTANPQLFTTQDQKQNLPQQIASAIQKMTQAVSIGGNASATAARLGARGASGAVGAANLGKYSPAGYNLPGMAYFPANTPATRPAMPVTPGGFSLISDADDTTPTVYADLAHADASVAIDALAPDGQDWKASGLGAPFNTASPTGTQRVGSIWSSFWNWVKGAVIKITHIIISVGKEAYAGLRFIYNDVVYFFKHPLQALEDVVSAVATFFKKVGKLIKNVVEALSLLLHMDEVVKTHRILRDELLLRVNGDPTNPSVYPGLVNLIKNQAQPKIDGTFDTLASDINGLLNKFANVIGDVGAKQPTDLANSDATAHSVCTVKSAATGKTDSHAVQCLWATHKLKTGSKTATVTTTSISTSMMPAQTDDAIGDALQTFFDGFITSITDNGPLQAQWEQVKQGFSALFNVSSATQFFAQGIADLLKTIALVLDAVIAVGKAMVDGLLDMAISVIDALFAPGTGLFTRTLNIPVLSSLFQALFGEPLTLLNAITLVAAIPVTLLGKVISGRYLSQGDGGQAAGRRKVADANGRLFKLAWGLTGVFNSLIGGFIGGISDVFGEAGPPRPIAILYAMSSCISVILAVPGFVNTNDLYASLEAWAISIGLFAVSLFGAVNPEQYPIAAKLSGIYGSIETAVLGGAQLAIFITSFVFDNNKAADAPAFAFSVLGSLDLLINPLKLLDDATAELGPFIVGTVDVLVGFIEATYQLATTIISYYADPVPGPAPTLPHRLHVPALHTPSFVPFAN